MEQKKVGKADQAAIEQASFARTRVAQQNYVSQWPSSSGLQLGGVGNLSVTDTSPAIYTSAQSVLSSSGLSSNNG